MKISAKRVLQFVIVAAVLLEAVYLGDWAVLRIRVGRGTAYGSVEVHQFLATSLKGSKTEYDLTGSFQQTCNHSIFPHDGNPACWWLKRHASVWQ
jgi:hypothetical protein